MSPAKEIACVGNLRIKHLVAICEYSMMDYYFTLSLQQAISMEMHNFLVVFVFDNDLLLLFIFLSII